jgi:TonB family protein
MVCVVRVHLYANGQVKRVAVEQSSDNKLFDESAKNAVYKADFFQMPNDKELLQEVLEGFPVHFGDE